MAKKIPILIFALGVGIAVIGGAKKSDAPGGWPDSVWIFQIGAILATVGITLWHEDRRMDLWASKANANPEAEGDPEMLLRGLMEPLEAFGERIGTSGADDITESVDMLLETYVLPFSRVRNKLAERYGMEKGAEILVVIAYGERLLNRVWSAAGDEHLPEARACFPEARDAFREAVILLEKA